MGGTTKGCVGGELVVLPAGVGAVGVSDISHKERQAAALRLKTGRGCWMQTN